MQNTLSVGNQNQKQRVVVCVTLFKNSVKGRQSKVKNWYLNQLCRK